MSMSDDVTLDLRLQAKYLRRGKVVAWRRRPKISQQDLYDYLISLIKFRFRSLFTTCLPTTNFKLMHR